MCLWTGAWLHTHKKQWVVCNIEVWYMITVYCCYIDLWGERNITNSMKENPSWEANNCSAGQEIPCLLWNPEVHFCVHRSPPVVPILSQINLMPAFPLYLFKIHSNILLLSMLWSSQWSLSFRFSDQNVCISHHSCACYILCPSWFDHPNNISYRI
jgi:hypothetical protein